MNLYSSLKSFFSHQQLFLSDFIQLLPSIFLPSLISFPVPAEDVLLFHQTLNFSYQKKTSILGCFHTTIIQGTRHIEYRQSYLVCVILNLHVLLSKWTKSCSYKSCSLGVKSQECSQNEQARQQTIECITLYIQRK